MPEARFRKRPIEVTAIQFTGGPESAAECMAFAGVGTGYASGADTLTIRTLEGPVVTHVGEWIVRGAAGEHYPVKPGIFEATFDRVNDLDPQSELGQTDDPAHFDGGGV